MRKGVPDTSIMLKLRGRGQVRPYMLREGRDSPRLQRKEKRKVASATRGKKGITLVAIRAFSKKNTRRDQKKKGKDNYLVQAKHEGEKRGRIGERR